MNYDSEAQYPRVLLMTANPLTRQHSNSITLTSLFEGWPKDRIAQVYAPFATPIFPEFEVCEKFWALGPKGLRRITPDMAPSDQLLAGSESRQRLIYQLSNKRWASKLAYPLREIWYSRPGLWKGPMLDEIDAFKPDLIFSNTGALYVCELMLWLRRRYDASIVPLFTDDWISTQFIQGTLDSHMKGYLRKRLLKAFHKIMDAATERMVISDAMAAEYAKRYGGSFLPFTQTVNASLFDPSPRPAASGAPVRFVYAGNLNNGRAQALSRIGRAITELGSAEMLVYSPGTQCDDFGAPLADLAAVRLMGKVPSSELPAVYHAADALVVVESFSPEHVAYTKLSLSTKVTEYQMAARPILGLGPQSLSTMTYIEKTKSGLVIGEDSDEAAMHAVRLIVGDSELRAQMAASGRANAMERHESVGQRERFRSVLSRAVQTHQAGSAGQAR